MEEMLIPHVVKLCILQSRTLFEGGTTKKHVFDDRDPTLLDSMFTQSWAPNAI